MSRKLVETFNTHLMSDEMVRKLDTARDSETKQIMDIIRNELKNPDKVRQHIAVYGPRGSGKSFLMRLIDLEIDELQKQQEKKEIEFVLLPEEQYNIQTAHRLLEVITTYLRGDSWAETGYRLDFRSEKEAWREAQKELEAAIDETFGEKRGLVVVAIENFDQLLVKMFGAGTSKGKKMKEGRIAEERLRSLMSGRGGRLMLIATATGTVDQNYERPLFQAFQNIDLEPWTPENCIEYFNRRRQLEEKDPLNQYERIRALAIATFTDGNPRLAQLLYEVLNTEDMLSITEMLDALTDELADYYRWRLEDLPPKSAGILDALIRGGEPESQSGLAQRVGATQNQIADSFRYLKTARLLSATRETNGKALLYRVRDRLFVYFYRRRYGDPSSANPLARIAELLESFLTDTEKEAQALHHLDAGNPNYAKTLLDLMPSSNTYCEYRDGGVQFGFPSLLQEIPTIIHPEEIASAVEQLKDDPLQFYEEWKKLFETRRSKENLDTQVILQCLLALAAARSKVISQARKHLEEAYHLAREEQNPNAQILALQHWGVFSWYVEKEKEMALKYLEEAGNLAKDATHLNRRQLALYSLAVVQGNKRNHKKAIATAQEAANLAQQMGDLRKQAKSLVFKGWSLGELGKHKDAIEILTEAAELASDVGDWNKQAECLRFKGWSLGKLGKHKDAIETLTEAAELAKKVGDWNEQAQCLRHQGWNLGQLGKHKDAIEILTEAAKLASDVGDWNEQAQCLRHQGWNLGQLGKHQEAAAAASDGFDCALKANDIKEAGWNLRLLVEQAAKIPFPDVISRVSDYFDQSANQDTDDLSFPSFFVGDLITATARLEQWSELHDLALKHQNSFSKSRFLFFSDFRGVGKVWTEKAQKEGRAALYSHIAEALPIIAQIMEALPLRTREDESPTSRHLQSLVQGLVSHCSDAGVLNDIADAVREVFGEEGEIAVQEIEAFATFHASGGTEKALEHIDPDFATAIRRIWNLSDPKDELWERLKARRRGS